MSPPKAERRPGRGGGDHDGGQHVIASVARVCGGGCATGKAMQVAESILDDFDAHERQRAHAFEAGYRAGFDAGAEVTLGHVRYQDEQRAAVLRRHVVGLNRGVPLSELERRRAEPGELALDWRRRHGGEHRGGPVEWATAS